LRAQTIRHRGPQQTRVLDRDVILLRKVNMRKMGPGLVDKLSKTALRPKEYEGDMPWFGDGYIAGEHPRDALMTQAIMQNTTGFAIARTDSGDIIAEFEKHEAARAEKVRASAKVELAVDVALRETDEDDPDEDE
jgi:hypothetical protein